MREGLPVSEVCLDRQEPKERIVSEHFPEIVHGSEGPAVLITGVVVEDRSSELL